MTAAPPLDAPPLAAPPIAGPLPEAPPVSAPLAAAAPLAGPLTDEQIRAWTPAQRLESLARLVGAVMAGQEGPFLRLPVTAAVPIWKIMPDPQCRVVEIADEDLSDSLKERLRRARLPNSSIPLTDEVWEQMMDQIDVDPE